MPVQLYALVWTNQETEEIQQWQEENADKVYIAGYSRILLEPLEKAVYDPGIAGLAIDGILIRDHTKHRPDVLREVIKKLEASFLKLYAVSNGIEPVVSPPMWQESPSS